MENANNISNVETRKSFFVQNMLILKLMQHIKKKMWTWICIPLCCINSLPVAEVLKVKWPVLFRFQLIDSSESPLLHFIFNDYIKFFIFMMP